MSEAIFSCGGSKLLLASWMFMNEVNNFVIIMFKKYAEVGSFGNTEQPKIRKLQTQFD